MKNTKVMVAALVFATTQLSFSQGFVNLDFESAKIIPLASGGFFPTSVAVTNALPGWNVFYGSIQESQITYNAPAVGSTFVSLLATNGQQISGNFSVLLQGGLSAAAATINQTGLVPVSSESIFFEGVGDGSLTSTLTVSLGGQALNYFSVFIGSNYTLYEAGIPTGMAGQTEELDFSVLEGQLNNWTLDNIQFSPTVVPEPGAYGLMALGGGLLVWRRRKNKMRPLQNDF